MSPIFSKDMLPTGVNGPISAAEKFCQQLWMGPLVLPKNSADGCRWANFFAYRNTADGVIRAQCCSRDMLPKVANRPIGAAEKFHRWLWMGQLFLSIWAQCCFRDMLPKAVNGPISAAETCCRLPQMDQSFLQRNAANGVIWAHCWSLIILNVPIIAAR